MTGDTQADKITRALRETLARYDSDDWRLMLSVLRQVARGQPVTPAEAGVMIAGLAIAPDQARHVLALTTERDANERIVGIMGLSLNDHPHHLTVGGQALAAWCALDTLFLPILLRQTVEIASSSRLSERPVRLRVGPESIDALDPADAVMSLVALDPRQLDLSSVEEVWSAFCTWVHFFATRAEAEEWAHQREGIVIVTVREGYDLARAVWGGVPAYDA
jgi:alkylmercury lyase-like protein